MARVNFIHCADLHIGTPFKGISESDTSLGSLLYQSTYQAFDNIVNLAIKEQVDCLLISGDVYDSEDKSLQAQLRFKDGLSRLSNAGIPSFIACGNHDPLNSWSAALEWPESVHVFPGDAVRRLPLIKGGETIAQVYGISHARKDLKENLALKFCPDGEQLPKIGLLHTNAGSNADHGPYAPCSMEDLIKVNLDYWALGHIHARDILRTANPAVVYSGCSQSTSFGEIGARGCFKVTLEPGIEPVIEFVSTDVVRYKSDQVDISDCLSVEDIISAVITKCKGIAGFLDNRSVVIRLSITGRTNLHSDLQRGDNLHDLLENVRDQLKDIEPVIWLDKLKLSTAGVYDLDSLRNGNNFVSDIISGFDELQQPGSQTREEFLEMLKPLFDKWQGRSYLEELSGEQLMALAVEARNQMLDLLLREK
jgi:DNA repair exonuclease SbcCD nuclease subunit